MARARFDRLTALSRNYVAATGFTYGGVDYRAGDPFPIAGLHINRVSTLYGSRRINYGPDRAAEPDPIQLTDLGGGYYELTAPWAETQKFRGKAKAEAAEAALREAGPPLGFIAGGTQITLEGGEGGWYQVGAPWLDEPEKVQGREAAEARQRELHQQGEPASHHGYTLTEGENGWWEIDSGLEGTEPEKVHGEEAARERAAELRQTWTAAQEQGVLIEGQSQENLDPRDSVLVMVDGPEAYRVVAPWLEEGETFETAEAAEARQAELREAGPPEGWEWPASPSEPPQEGQEAAEGLDPPREAGKAQQGAQAAPEGSAASE